MLRITLPFFLVLQMGVYDINPGECEDTLSIRDKSGYTKNILPSDKKLDGVKLISESNEMTIQLSTCFHFERNNANTFELKVSMIGLCHFVPNVNKLVYNWWQKYNTWLY